ncbi:hypothetical protein OsI_36764 [Oryza sativa Indica Group]|uniref:MATH domain-containing protein n=1 Tax=Oryza sativa subsp. indica TaxID=39946 RepID=B8BLG5_ORYSI|nr:hypothetical protein OsI_36764 [Oryza sativa Indica Group]
MADTATPDRRPTPPRDHDKGSRPQSSPHASRSQGNQEAEAGRIERTASSIVSRPSTTSHVLRVDGYSHLVGVLQPGEHVDSCVFDAGGHSWRLQLYPNGSNDQTHRSHIGVFLQLAAAAGHPSDGDGRVRARPRFSLVDSAGDKPAAAPPSHDAGFHSFGHGDGWGFQSIISREELERSEYLRDDCFAIQCDVDVTTVRKCHDHPVFISQNFSENRVSDAT